MTDWRPDVLDGYQQFDLPLPDAESAVGEDPDTELVATLVRRLRPGARTRTAVLYVHGWNDYFFQVHLADELLDHGYDFYALELRRYGRSLRPGQLAGFVSDLDHYDAELDAAADMILADHDQLVLMGHSTGGLVATLWADRHQDRVAALVLNSPWLDLQGSWVVRALGSPVIDALGERRPTAILPMPDRGYYARTLHAGLGGEWDYDQTWKQSPGPAVRVGWLRAILRGHQRIAAGLSLQQPILVMAAGRSDVAVRWKETFLRSDIVLDVDQIVARAPKLGRQVTVLRFEDAIHDLVLSAEPVRACVMADLRRWLRAYGPACD
ncbi:alpha/beta hydrolase [Microlunatus speluncae]|uniref:alpha/beta hydrolase n=1 Tax=Microlunatus speluncae TaxID=2594267 RepID=UPI0012663022|nr:alpha/beta hydrolase [Microlunatus speluncae]